VVSQPDDVRSAFLLLRIEVWAARRVVPVLVSDKCGKSTGSPFSSCLATEYPSTVVPFIVVQ
jgi:hypothetical protein